MNTTALDQFKDDILEIANIYEIAKSNFNKRSENGYPYFIDYRAHTILDLCIVAGVSAFEYYLKERLRPCSITKKYNFQSLDSVNNLLYSELGINFESLNLTSEEIISLKILFQWRHIIVHNGKRMDEKFIGYVSPLYKRLGLDFNHQIGDRVLFEPKRVENFIDTLEEFVIKLDPLLEKSITSLKNP